MRWWIFRLGVLGVLWAMPATGMARSAAGPVGAGTDEIRPAAGAAIPRIGAPCPAVESVVRAAEGNGLAVDSVVCEALGAGAASGEVAREAGPVCPVAGSDRQEIRADAWMVDSVAQERVAQCPTRDSVPGGVHERRPACRAVAGHAVRMGGSLPAEWGREGVGPILPEALHPVEAGRPKRPLDRRLHHGYDGWERIVPTHTRIQYAGSIGVVSMGFGWDYGRRGQWETDVLLGVIPSYNSDKAKLTFTLKETCVPWSLAFNDRFSFEPLACGVFFSTIVSNEFWVREPDRYPKGYYFFSTRIRSHVFAGSRLTCRVNTRRTDRLLRSITVYYELSTCDLYVISRVKNRTLHTGDILSLSFGVRFGMFDVRREGAGGK